MPRSRRYGRLDELPGTFRRSCQEARESFSEALSSAILLYGNRDQAHRTASAALKANFEKCGDHWVPKHQPAD